MPAQSVGRAWIALCLALALHVIDEALTGFLDVYNPSVRVLRERWPWLPLPVFTFEKWIVSLALVIAMLLALSGFVGRGARWARALGYGFSALMIANALGHALGTIFGRTVGTIAFPRPMPGFYSSPVLFIASVYLLKQLRATRRIRA
jgi:hypothetical protein